MKKRILAFFIAIIIVGGLISGIVIGCYKGIQYLDYKTKIVELDPYNIEKEEVTITKFEIKDYKYMITRLRQGEATVINILLKDKGKIYILDKLLSCDTTDKAENIYVNKNMIYVHCIGEEREVNEFELNGASIYKDKKRLNYEKSPNVSGAHLLIEKSTKKYLYLYSSVRKNESIPEGNKIKCSLETNECIYNIEKEKKEEENKEENKEEKQEEKKEEDTNNKSEKKSKSKKEAKK